MYWRMLIKRASVAVNVIWHVLSFSMDLAGLNFLGKQTNTRTESILLYSQKHNHDQGQSTEYSPDHHLFLKKSS